MGVAAKEPTDEDTLCAQFIKASLEGKIPDFEPVRKHLRGYRSARKFFDPALAWAPKRDFDLCLSLSRFNFVLQAQWHKQGYHILQKIPQAS
jgi:2-phosphosulfolactate phosphatase